MQRRRRTDIPRLVVRSRVVGRYILRVGMSISFHFRRELFLNKIVGLCAKNDRCETGGHTTTDWWGEMLNGTMLGAICLCLVLFRCDEQLASRTSFEYDARAASPSTGKAVCMETAFIDDQETGTETSAAEASGSDRGSLVSHHSLPRTLRSAI